MNSKVTMVIDRYDFTFVIFHRDNSGQGRLYYKPSLRTRTMLARTLTKGFNEGKIACYQTAPNVYAYKGKKA